MEITKDLLKIFTDWTKLKVRIHTSEKALYAKERQIWWASLGQNIGVEINGKNDNFERPVLVLKVFSKQALWVLPISSKIKEGEYYYHFENSDGEENIVNMSQLRLISSGRLLRKLGQKMAEEDFNKIREKVKNYI